MGICWEWLLIIATGICKKYKYVLIDMFWLVGRMLVRFIDFS